VAFDMADDHGSVSAQMACGTPGIRAAEPLSGDIPLRCPRRPKELTFLALRWAQTTAPMSHRGALSWKLGGTSRFCCADSVLPFRGGGWHRRRSAPFRGCSAHAEGADFAGAPRVLFCEA